MSEQYNQIGETAGKIFKALEKGGARTLTALQKDAKVTDTALFNQAIGWLAREGKLDFQKQGTKLQVAIGCVCHS